MPLNIPIDTIRYRVRASDNTEIGVLFKIRGPSKTVMWQFHSTEPEGHPANGMTKYTLNTMKNSLEDCRFSRYNSTSPESEQ